MKFLNTMLRKKKTENLQTPIDFLLKYFYILRSQAIRMTKPPDLSLLQIENEGSECPAMIITFCKEKTQDTTGKQEYRAAICHKNALFCLIEALAMELF